MPGMGMGMGMGMPPAGGMPPAAPPAPADPATTYASQQQRLQDMGFGDTAANWAINMNAAVERLLSSM